MLINSAIRAGLIEPTNVTDFLAEVGSEGPANFIQRKREMLLKAFVCGKFDSEKTLAGKLLLAWFNSPDEIEASLVDPLFGKVSEDVKQKLVDLQPDTHLRVKQLATSAKYAFSQASGLLILTKRFFGRFLFRLILIASRNPFALLQTEKSSQSLNFDFNLPSYMDADSLEPLISAEIGHKIKVKQFTNTKFNFTIPAVVYSRVRRWLFNRIKAIRHFPHRGGVHIGAATILLFEGEESGDSRVSIRSYPNNFPRSLQHETMRLSVARLSSSTSKGSLEDQMRSAFIRYMQRGIQQLALLSCVYKPEHGKLKAFIRFGVPYLPGFTNETSFTINRLEAIVVKSKKLSTVTAITDNEMLALLKQPPSTKPSSAASSRRERDDNSNSKNKHNLQSSFLSWVPPENSCKIDDIIKQKNMVEIAKDPETITRDFIIPRLGEVKFTYIAKTNQPTRIRCRPKVWLNADLQPANCDFGFRILVQTQKAVDVAHFEQLATRDPYCVRTQDRRRYHFDKTLKEFCHATVRYRTPSQADDQSKSRSEAFVRVPLTENDLRSEQTIRKFLLSTWEEAINFWELLKSK